MVEVAPSILTVDFERLDAEILDLIENGADRIHIDVMDGKFVKNVTPGAEMYAAGRRVATVPLDVHLMVDNPKQWLEENVVPVHSVRQEEKESVAAHCCVHQENEEVVLPTTVSFHIETMNSHEASAMVAFLREHGIKASIAIKPDTPVETIKPFLEQLDMVLVMTVEPGYGGQKMIEACLEKVKQIREWQPMMDIEVDGGINLGTVAQVKAAGANVLVAGTAIAQAQNRREIIALLKE